MAASGHSRTVLQGFAGTIGLEFNDWALLGRALTHPSWGYENGSGVPDNERLEFLGDSVLGLVVSHRLYERYPDRDEGYLTRIKSTVVSEQTLATIGKQLHLQEMVLLGKGAAGEGDRERPSVIANALEAVIGALYLDRGLENARTFILANWETIIDQVASGEVRLSYSSDLQELLQKHLKEEPRYDLLSAEGPDNDRTFCMQVAIGGIILGRGEGRTKKGARTLAARQALTLLSRIWPEGEGPRSREELESAVAAFPAKRPRSKPRNERNKHA